MFRLVFILGITVGASVIGYAIYLWVKTTKDNAINKKQTKKTKKL